MIHFLQISLLRPLIEINTDIEILKICCCITSTKCVPKKLFSVLKRVKLYLRNSMAEERFNHTSILVINSDITSALDYDNITEFLVAKSSK